MAVTVAALVITGALSYGGLAVEQWLLNTQKKSIALSLSQVGLAATISMSMLGVVAMLVRPKEVGVIIRTLPLYIVLQNIALAVATTYFNPQSVFEMALGAIAGFVSSIVNSAVLMIVATAFLAIAAGLYLPRLIDRLDKSGLHGFTNLLFGEEKKEEKAPELQASGADAVSGGGGEGESKTRETEEMTAEELAQEVAAAEQAFEAAAANDDNAQGSERAAFIASSQRKLQKVKHSIRFLMSLNVGADARARLERHGQEVNRRLGLGVSQ